MPAQPLTRSRSWTRTLGPVGALGLVLALGLSPAHAAEAPVGLGTAGSFAVLAGQSVTNTGPSIVSGDIGVGPGTSVTGIPPLVQTGGVLHVADAVANQAQADLTTAYNSAAGRLTVTDVTGDDLGGKTYTSGVVTHTSGMQLTGTVILDAQGDPNAVFIFQAGSTLITASNSTVALINGASPCNVFWQVGSSATLGTNTTFVGTVMSLTSATLNTGASVQGRVLARNGSVTLDTNVINRPTCATPASPTPSTTSPSATASPSATTSVSPSPTPSPGSGGNGNGNGNGGDSGNGGDNGDSSGGDNGDSSGGDSGDSSGGDSGGDSGGGDSGGGDSGGGDSGGGDSLTTDSSQDTPVVPTGHPETGQSSAAAPTGPGWAAFVLLGGSALAAAALRWRRPRAVRPS
jgi:hypothetical protein